MQGALFPREHAVMSSEVEGRVAQVVADFGDKVTAGQVMLKINPREYELRVETAQAALDQARAKLANSTARYNRARTLKEAESISAEQFDQIASQMRVDQADTESARRSARDGAQEARRHRNQGAVQRLGAKADGLARRVRLARQGNLRTDRDRPDQAALPDARAVRAAGARRDAGEAGDRRDQGTSYTGKITRIAPALDESSRTLLIEAEVANPDGALKPGFFAHVTMDLGHDRALFVPSAAVLRYAGVARVFIVEQGVVRAREVTTGSVVGDQTEITGGLKEGEHVAVSDVDRLADGTAVVAKEQS